MKIPGLPKRLIIRRGLVGLLTCLTAVPMAADEITVVYPVPYVLYQRTSFRIGRQTGRPTACRRTSTPVVRRAIAAFSIPLAGEDPLGLGSPALG